MGRANRSSRPDSVKEIVEGRLTRYRCEPGCARLAGNAWYSTVSRANAILSASNSWLARVTDVYAPRSDELETCNVLVTSPATCAVPRSRLLRILGKICLVHSEFLSFPHPSVANSLATLSPRKYSRTKIKRNVEFYIYIYIHTRYKIMRCERSANVGNTRRSSKEISIYESS